MEYACVQAQLNQGGGWERLCVERDPFILTGLMWSWLEQLKEPVISLQEALALNTDAQNVLNTLDKVDVLISSDQNREKKHLHQMLPSSFPGPQRNDYLHSRLYGPFAEGARRGGERVP